MKQIIQNYKTGELELAEVPVPICAEDNILVRTHNSLISAGTEKLMINLSKKNLLGKAKARPDKVKKVIAKIKSAGIMKAYKLAMSRLDNPIPLGYSCAGKVIEVGEKVDKFTIGDRVACFRSGFATHAEINVIPENLAVKIPEDLSFEEASFVTLGGITLHSVRCADVKLGENVVVIGLGLLGLIGIQLLKSSGCNVFGIDIDPNKLKLAKELGVDGFAKPDEDINYDVDRFTQGNGADAVIIFASTKSNEPIEMAAEIARERANIIVPGMVGLNIPRKTFFEKELNLVVSRSSGPKIYESKTVKEEQNKYISYVRWNERRNMQEFLILVKKGKVNLSKLITHHFKISEALNAYEIVVKGKEPYIGIVLEYNNEQYKDLSSKLTIKEKEIASKPKDIVKVGMIGAGQYAKETLLPAIKRLKKPYRLVGVATSSGYTGKHVAKKFDFEYCTTNYKEILNDKDIDLVIITTRHGSHSRFVVESLKADKVTFIEKPLCIKKSELKNIVKAYRDIKNVKPGLMVGFNRRFSPYTSFIKDHLGDIEEPIVINYRVNAGFVPKDSWVHNPEEGGGRVIGEVCHFVDLIQYISDSQIEKVYAESIEGGVESLIEKDNISITLKTKNGSVGNIIYVANGDKSFPRERIEIFGKGSVGVIDNFKFASFTRNRNKTTKKSYFKVDYGQQNEMKLLFNSVSKGTSFPVSFEEYVNTTLTTFKIEQSLRTGKPEIINGQ